ncbi:MAG: hypothetical protein IPK87_02035 [Planctomycetes bacterium]|nr:hypothetical protein [Planctomycetota bacterium]
MGSRLCLAALLVACGALVVAGEEDAVRNPYKWAVSGDTLETFKAEFVSNHKADRSSPRALVETWAAWTDGRYGMDLEFDRVNRLWAGAVRKAMHAEEGKLLSAEAQAELEKVLEKAAEPRGDAKRQQTTHPLRVTDESDGENGARHVEALQKYEIKEKQRDGSWHIYDREEQWRFTCVKGGDEKWLIRRIEFWKLDLELSTRDKPVYKWDELDTLLDFFYFSRADVAKARELVIPDLKNDTAESTALSLFATLAPTRARRIDLVMDKGLNGWINAVEGLVTEATQAKAEASALKRVDAARPRAVPTVVETLAADDGTTVVRISAKADGTSADEELAEVHVRKTEAGWRVTQAGTSVSEAGAKAGPDGKTARVFSKYADIYALASRINYLGGE